MKDITDKLELIRRQRQQELLESLKGALFPASELLSRSPQEKGSLLQLLPEAQLLSNSAGQVLFSLFRVPLSGKKNQRGHHVPHAQKLELLSEGLASLLSDQTGPLSFAPQDLLFLDLETTGLAGGTGTYPFLIGLGFVAEGEFRVEQYFMEDFDREPAQLQEVGRRLQDFKLLVTYNGRSFDVPLLRNRFILNRLRPPLEMPHLDLLLFVRRFWKKILSECSLSRVEQDLLGITRQHDIDGSLVPRLYLNFLRSGDPRPLLPVFDHNAQDIASLLSLLLTIVQLVATPSYQQLTEPELLYRLGRWFIQQRSLAPATECWERALFHCRQPELESRLKQWLGAVYKRCQEWDKARELWEEQIRYQNCSTPQPFIELAKYLEHRERDFDQALNTVEAALQFATQLQSARLEYYLHDLEHRRKRLQRKLKRQRS